MKEKEDKQRTSRRQSEKQNLDKRQVVSIETGGKSIDYKNLYSSITMLTFRQSTPRSTSTSKFNQFRTPGSTEAGSEPSCKITTFFTKCILRLSIYSAFIEPVHCPMNRFDAMKIQKRILNIKNYNQLRSFIVNLIQAQVRTLLARNLLKRSTTDWRTAES